MAEKEILERIAAAVQDAEATRMRSWTGRGTRSRRKLLRRFIAFAFQWIGSRSCASWRLSVVSSRPC